MPVATKWLLRQRAAFVRMINEFGREDHDWSSQEIGMMKDAISAKQHIDEELQYRGVEIPKQTEKC